MHRRSLHLLVLAILGLSLARGIDAASYRLDYQAGDSDVRVTLEPTRAQPGPRVLVMPRAIPMGYGEQHSWRVVSRAHSSRRRPSSDGCP